MLGQQLEAPGHEVAVMKLDEVKVRGVSGHRVVSRDHGEQVVLVIIVIQSLESC